MVAYAIEKKNDIQHLSIVYYKQKYDNNNNDVTFPRHIFIIL